MLNTKEEIAKLEQKIQQYSKKRNKIENANYILAMQIKDIQEGKLTNIEDIIKWDFEMIRMGDTVNQITNNKNN